MNLRKGKHLYCMNTFFKKTPQRKWTWRSPNGSVKNETDYILTNNRHTAVTSQFSIALTQEVTTDLSDPK